VLILRHPQVPQAIRRYPSASQDSKDIPLGVEWSEGEQSTFVSFIKN